ncbi:MAG: Asp-tRNA(Asn)/Glu-tRNA(Gln) amidotransferase GatCAB subunit A, partial [Nitrospinae bacterium]|nr:Asp-tRNA(Asn)/Glu-tRNA(Gln) amidotransferase GatCAB subunit A [Nitrospinota bacterium]
IPLAWTLDHPGPMVRSVADAALMLHVIAGHDPRDPTTVQRPVPDYTQGLTGDLRGVRIGLPRPVFLDDLDPEVEAALKGAMRDLEGLGASVEIVPLPKMRHAQLSSSIIIGAEAAAYHLESLRQRADQFGPDVGLRLKLGALLPAWAYLKAQRMREAIRQEMEAAMAHVDVLLTPTVAIEAPTIEQCTVTPGGPLPPVLTQVARLTRPFNLTGSPVISIPCGFTFGGLPIGMQIVGKPFDEGMVLRVAHAYEQATEWHSRRPSV